MSIISLNTMNLNYPKLQYFVDHLELATPLSVNLTQLHQILKKLHLLPTSKIGLEAYQLVCQRYLNKTSRNAEKQSKNGKNSLQSPKFNHSIDDPQLNIFSFAKQKKHLPLNIDKNLPKKLSYNHYPDQKLLSEKVQIKNYGSIKQLPHSISSFNLSKPAFSFADEHSIDQILLQKQQKQDQLKEQEEKYQLIKFHIKLKAFNQLKRLVQKQKQLIKRLLRKRSAEFHVGNVMKEKVMRCLKGVWEQRRGQYQKAIQHGKRNDQYLLQEYFIAWRQRALMTQAEIQYQQQIQQKYSILSKLRFISSLKKLKSQLNSSRDKLNNKYQQLSNILLTNAKKIFYRQIKSYSISQKTIKNHLLTMKQSIKKNLFLSLGKVINKLKIYRSSKEQLRVSYFLKNYNGRMMINKLRQQYLISKIYFKNRSKFIGVCFFFEHLKVSLEEKGYRHAWMKELPENVERLDQKYDRVYKNYKLSKIFGKLRQQLSIERQKIQIIKSFHANKVIKQLLYNYKLKIIKEKQKHKVTAFTQIRSSWLISSTLETLRGFNNHFKDKVQLMNEMVYCRKVSKALEYLKNYSRASIYYEQKVDQNLNKMRDKNIRNVFKAFREQIMTRIINNKIVLHYNRYLSNNKLRTIFNELKHNTFNQKIMNKRIANIRKIILINYVDRFLYNSRVSMYGNYKQKNIEFHGKSEKLMDKQKKVYLVKFRRYFSMKRQIKRIKQHIDEEFQLRFQWRMFNIFKITIIKMKQQKIKAKMIQRNGEIKIKKYIFDKMITKLILSIILKGLDNKFQRKLKRESFDKLQQEQEPKQAIQLVYIQEKDNIQDENNSQQ